MRLLRHLACPVRPCATVVTRPVCCQAGREPDSGHSDCVRRHSGRPDSVQSAFVSIRGGRWSFCPFLPRRPGKKQKWTPYVGDMAVWSGQSLKLSVLVGRFNRWPAFPEPDKWNRWVCRGVCRSPRGASRRPGHGEGVDHARGDGKLENRDVGSEADKGCETADRTPARWARVFPWSFDTRLLSDGFS